LIEHIISWLNSTSTLQTTNRKQKMFKKLVANLPYNPSLITQVGFYADRMRAEKSIRRLSFVFMALAMTVQSLAVISPPERSLAYSNNYVISGLNTKQDILDAYDNPDGDVKAIYTRFNLSRGDIASLTDKPNVTIRSNDGNDWWTIGRSSLWGFNNVNNVYKQNQVEVKYRGSGTPTPGTDASVYARQLRAWDIRNPFNTYKAWEGISDATGQKFWILQDCGNITWVGEWEDPTPQPEKKPELHFKKTIGEAPSTLKPGDSFTYRLEYRNKKIGTTAKDAVITDELQTDKFDVVSPQGLNISNGFLKYPVGDLVGSEKNQYLELTVRLKDQLNSPEQICNAARLTSSNAGVKNSKACTTVITPCPYDSAISKTNNKNCVEPVVKCQLVDVAINRSTREVTFKTIFNSSNEASTTVKSYNYDFGDGETSSAQSSEFSNTVSHTYEPGDFEATVTVTYRTLGQEQTTDQQQTCSIKIDFEEDQALGQQKTVENITKDLVGADALNSKVSPGDVLEYTLFTLNSQNYERTGVEVSDYIGDILDYATLDLEALAAEGGRFDEDTNKVIWEGVVIPAKSKIGNTFRVQLLNPIPATNQPSAVSTDYDCVISNSYGNDINLNVQCPLVKGIETIPNTGPGTSLLMIGGATMVVGYFFARSRLLSKEIDIIRTDFVATGGV